MWLDSFCADGGGHLVRRCAPEGRVGSDRDTLNSATHLILCYRFPLPSNEDAMEEIDWSQCEDVERIPGKVSGSWLVKDTRLPVWAILENADDHAPEEIANDIFEGVSPETVRRIIAFARLHAPATP
jgi:uncharacterized protein (DUF433 family)